MDDSRIIQVLAAGDTVEQAVENAHFIASPRFTGDRAPVRRMVGRIKAVHAPGRPVRVFAKVTFELE